MFTCSAEGLASFGAIKSLIEILTSKGIISYIEIAKLFEAQEKNCVDAERPDVAVHFELLKDFCLERKHFRDLLESDTLGEVH